MKSFLFAYGTLNPSMAPPPIRLVVKPLRKVARAVVRGKLLNLDHYPGAIFIDSASTLIRGTVYRLPTSHADQKELLRQLDGYEGVNPRNPAAGLYIRKKLPVTLKNGKSLDCWVYEYNGDVESATTIEDGIFRKPARR